MNINKTDPVLIGRFSKNWSGKIQFLDFKKHMKKIRGKKKLFSERITKNGDLSLVKKFRRKKEDKNRRSLPYVLLHPF
jgi:hypothetical protein